MGLRVNTNISSITAQRNLSGITSKLDGSYRRLSSGLRIAIAADDAAGLGISERMRTQIRSHNAALRNAQDGIALVQTAEGALSEVNNILARMRELAIQSANGTLNSTDRSTIQNEITLLSQEVDRIATTTSFNGVLLFNGSTTSLDIQVGINAGEVIAAILPNVTTTTLGISALDVTTAANATASLAGIDTAVVAITSARGALGAQQNRMQSAVASIANVRENLSAAESRIRDADIAAETAELTRNTILQQAAVSVLAQANVQPQLALSLLG